MTENRFFADKYQRENKLPTVIEFRESACSAHSDKSNQHSRITGISYENKKSSKNSESSQIDKSRQQDNQVMELSVFHEDTPSNKNVLSSSRNSKINIMNQGFSQNYQAEHKDYGKVYDDNQGTTRSLNSND